MSAKLKKVSVYDLKAGMKTGADVVSTNGRLVVKKDFLLTEESIERIKQYSIFFVVIEEEEPHTENYMKRLSASKEFKEFEQKFMTSVEQLSGKINDIVEKNSPVNVGELLASTSEITDGTYSGNNMLDMLGNMHQYDDSTYVHSLNVALISRIVGEWLGFSQKDLELLSVCGLLHDIGKVKIPDSIVKKPGKLTPNEYEIVKKHTVFGYEILKNQNLAQSIINTPLMHHEKCDGSGYPNKLKRDQIDDFVKIVTIADVYDAMTSARVYRNPISPFEVVEIFEKEGLQKYESKYILTFLKKILDTYIHTNVKLNDGREGEVVFINRDKLSKPIVSIDGVCVDLSREKNLFIEKMV